MIEPEFHPQPYVSDLKLARLVAVLALHVADAERAIRNRWPDAGRLSGQSLDQIRRLEGADHALGVLWGIQPTEEERQVSNWLTANCEALRRLDYMRLMQK